MLMREYYMCDMCGWEVERGCVVWGLIELEDAPRDLAIGLCLNEALFTAFDDRKLCPECDTVLQRVGRTIRNDNKPEIMGAPYKTPLHSDALALTSENVAEHKEKFPDIEIDDKLRPIFTNARQHDDYMKKCGVVKQTQRTGKSKGKIYSYPGCKCS